jgi:hypothetical protein
MVFSLHMDRPEKEMEKIAWATRPPSIWYDRWFQFGNAIARTDSSGAEVQFTGIPNVGAEAPTP